MAGKDFNPEGGLDIYTLLPLWCNLIKPEEKETVALTVHKHVSFIVWFVWELHKVCHIPMKDMHNSCLCIDCDLKKLVKLNMEAPY